MVSPGAPERWSSLCRRGAARAGSARSLGCSDAQQWQRATGRGAAGPRPATLPALAPPELRAVLLAQPSQREKPQEKTGTMQMTTLLSLARERGSIVNYLAWLARGGTLAAAPTGRPQSCGHPGLEVLRVSGSCCCLACGHRWDEHSLFLGMTPHPEQHAADWSAWIESIGGERRRAWLVVFDWKPRSFHRTRDDARIAIRALKGPESERSSPRSPSERSPPDSPLDDESLLF